MIELLLVPAAGLTMALFGEKFKSKNDDKRKIDECLKERQPEEPI